MKCMIHIKKTVLFFILTALLTGCATVSKHTSKPVLIGHPERFFWEIRGETSSVYVLGTVHVADKTFFPLEPAVLQAFDRADRLVSEIGGTEDLQAFTAVLQDAIMKNLNTDPKKNLLEVLSEEELIFLYGKIGEDMVHQLALFNPWILNLTLTQLLLYEAGLNAADGIDMHLIGRAGGKKIEALDTPEQQLAVVSYGSFDEQLLMLKDSIQALQNPAESIQEIQKLKQLYLQNDRKGLTALLFELLKLPDSFSAAQKQAFVDVLLTDRNRIWARKFDSYLKAGGTTFVFAGAAHFAGESNVFELMRREHLLQ